MRQSFVIQNRVAKVKLFASPLVPPLLTRTRQRSGNQTSNERFTGRFALCLHEEKTEIDGILTSMGARGKTSEIYKEMEMEVFLGAMGCLCVIGGTLIVLKHLNLLRDPAHDASLKHRIEDLEQAVLNLAMHNKTSSQVNRPSDKEPEEYGLEQEVSGLMDSQA
jgi:hypothetical protein